MIIIIPFSSNIEHLKPYVFHTNVSFITGVKVPHPPYYRYHHLQWFTHPSNSHTLRQPSNEVHPQQHRQHPRRQEEQRPTTPIQRNLRGTIQRSRCRYLP